MTIAFSTTRSTTAAATPKLESTNIPTRPEHVVALPNRAAVAKVLEWLCSSLGISGSMILAANLWFSPYGWILFATSAACGLVWARMVRLTSMQLMYGIFLVINLVGIWRYMTPGTGG